MKVLTSRIWQVSRHQEMSLSCNFEPSLGQIVKKLFPLSFSASILALLSLFIGLVGSLFSCPSIWAFEVSTHRQLAEKAIEVMESELNTYLVVNLGLEGGLNTSFNGMTARAWMIEGSNFEDDFPRFNNHFHDPMSNDGLGGVFNSAIDWSLQAIGEQKYSWNDAREYYFKALTSPTKAERDENWGKTFRALGQIMHLIQDMASPAHVRNDAHLSYFGIGNVDGLHDYMERQSVASYLGGGMVGPDRSILEQAGATRPEPFSNLFDANQYTVSNPDATLGGYVGLAEYANANFFSDDTIPFQPFFNFPSYNHPNLSEVIPAISPFPSGQSYVALLRLGSPTDPHARIAKYTGNQALAKFTLAHLQYDLIGQLQLDDAVYDAYSSHLIPRAVGYSAAVLEYFFRGDLSILRSEFEVAENVDHSLIEPGVFEVYVEIPPSLAFQGTVSFYYDRIDGERVSLQQQEWDGKNPFRVLGGSFFQGLAMLEPVRWYVVLDGFMGPGSQEHRAIVGKTGLAEWVISLTPI